jgi:hypothetical protein
MRSVFILYALAIGVGMTACGAATTGDGVAEESAQTASSATAPSKPAPSEATDKPAAIESAYVNAYRGCISVCFRRSQRRDGLRHLVRGAVSAVRSLTDLRLGLGARTGADRSRRAPIVGTPVTARPER